MRLESVTVAPDAVQAVIRFEPDQPLRTSGRAGLVDAVVRTLPGLKGHRCHNNEGLGFAEEMRDTEVAHLIEHVALEIMALAGSPETLRGDTAWDFARDGRGVFAVRLEYDDSAIALGSLTLAAELVDALSEGAEPPDVADEVRRLRGMRGR